MRYLHKFLGQLERKSPDVHVREVTTNDCRHFLDGWIERSPSTVCSIHSAVRATAHALRRASAVAFLTRHPGAIESLQALINHSRIDTTQVYLRALNKSKAMEPFGTSPGGSGYSRAP